jgi:hypothetical protein
VEEQHQPAVPLLLGDDVRAVLFQPLFDLIGRQSAFARAELFEDRSVFAARRLDDRVRHLNMVARPLQKRQDVFR